MVPDAVIPTKRPDIPAASSFGSANRRRHHIRVGNQRHRRGFEQFSCVVIVTPPDRFPAPVMAA
jgi:hypothetical protein